jgi:protein-disulfide isomerase
MASGFIGSALDALTTKKGAVLAGAAMLSLAALVNVSRSDPSNQAAAQLAGTPAPAPAAQALSTTPAKVFSPDQVKALHVIIKDYLVANQQIMVEVTKELERRQQAEQAAAQAKLIAEQKAHIFAQEADFSIGGDKNSVTVVEFFDYNCGWCKRAVNDIVNLQKSDPKLRFIMKEFPIFGEDSAAAAKAALASKRQGKYWEFHNALMREKRVTAANLFKIAEDVGLDVAKLKTDMADPKIAEAIRQNTALAQALNIEGTPGFVIDSRVNVGYIPADNLRRMVEDIRKTGCKMC